MRIQGMAILTKTAGTPAGRQVKRVIGKRDERLKQNKDKADLGNKKKAAEAAPELIREVYVAPSHPHPCDGYTER